MQTILGAGGTIGQPLAKALRNYTDKIRLVSRHPVQVNGSDELLAADLTETTQIHRAIAGSEVVYLTIGLPYKTSVWKEQWPKLMKEVLRSCHHHGARLVFFDNIYSYDPQCLGHMTEDCPIHPPSKKGKVRAEVLGQLREAMDQNRIPALIARSADFLSTRNSMLIEMVYKNLMKGKKGTWFCSLDRVHQFTYAGDAARATAELGNTEDAFGQVWHLPTDHQPLTGRQWIDLFTQALGVKGGYRVFPPWMLSLLGPFIPVLAELKEMQYQYDRDYVFDSSKFEQRFGWKATPPQVAVAEVVRQLRQPGG